MDNQPEIIDLDKDETNFDEMPEENGQYEYCEEGSQDQLDDEDIIGLEEVEHIENEDNGMNMILPVNEESALDITEKSRTDNMMVVDEWDDDDFDSFSDEEVKEEDKNVINPESIEKALINMPTMKNLHDDTGSFKQNRRIFISPLSLEDLQNEKLQNVMNRPTCLEVKVQWVRSNVDQTFIGILSLNFTTPNSALKAVKELDNFKEGIEIKCDLTNPVDEFISKNQMKCRITDCILILKNLTNAATVDAIKEIFPGVDDVVLHVKPDKSESAATIPRGFAYLLFETAELAAATVLEATDKHLELDGHRIFVLAYRPPVDSISRYYLKLHERKFILLLTEKLKKRIEVLENIPSAKSNLEDVKKRVASCVELIERDDKCRKSEMNLDTPSLDELLKMRGLPILDVAERTKIMDRHRINKAKKTPSKHERSNDRGSKSKLDDRNHKGQWRRPPRRVSPLRRRLSPQNFRDRRRGGAGQGGYDRREGSNMGRSLMNPLALMMQQNLGMMGQSSLVNQNMMLPNVLGGAGLLGAQPGIQSLLSGNLDMAGEMLRLDETGNYRPDQRGDRRFSPQRDNEYGNKRRRSRSPRLSREEGGNQGGNAPNNPVNLLMNLSQILSQKMENQRIIEKRDRDYRQGFR